MTENDRHPLPATEPPTKPRVLVVDDDAAMLKSLSFLLRARGYRPDTAQSGQEALDLLAETEYECMLLDLQMPEMSGQEVLRYVTEQNIDTKVVIVSGEASIAAVKETMKDGAYDFVRKPYAPGELLTTVGNALARTRLERSARQMAQALEDSERLHRYIVNHSPDFVYVLDADGCFTFVNDRAEDLLGYRREDLLGRHFSLLICEDDLPEAKYVFCERRTGKRASRDVELRLKVNSESRNIRYFETHVLPISLHSAGIYNPEGGSGRGTFLGTYGCARDITDRKRNEELIHYQAYHDLLTSLPNRALFRDRLQQAIAHNKRYGRLLAVMFIDLDRFKLVNDTLGHTGGDQVLLAAAERIQGCLRDEDTLSRFGGDEFTLLLPQLACRDDAAVVAEKIRTTLRQPLVVNDQEVGISGSIGIALFPAGGETPDSLLKSADVAMYAVKSGGKDDYRFYSDDLSDAGAGHLVLERDLCRAVEADQFEIFFQPKVDVETCAVVGLEALLRWRHPAKGLLLPGEFIPRAEQTRLIVPIGDWVLRATCEEVRRWRQAGLPPVKTAVNISVVQIEQPDFLSKMLGILEEYGFEGSCFEIEITEHGLVKQRDNVINKLKKLSAHGITIAIDDFGTGYSSLSYLQQFPIHTLKIDRSFVGDIEAPGQEACIVDAIAAMAHGLRLNLVAEGVETEVQLEYLRQRGCSQVQGFLFGRPLSAQDTFELLGRLPDGRLESCLARRLSTR